MLAAQCDALPEHRSPGELFESPTDSRHIAQLATVKPAKNLYNSLIGQALKVGTAAIGSLAVPGWWTNSSARHSTICGQTTSWRRCGCATGYNTAASRSNAANNAGTVVLIVAAACHHQTAACAARMVTRWRWRHQCGISLIQTRRKATHVA